jgi:hypothetical protein
VREALVSNILLFSAIHWLVDVAHTPLTVPHVVFKFAISRSIAARARYLQRYLAVGIAPTNRAFSLCVVLALRVAARVFSSLSLFLPALFTAPS